MPPTCWWLIAESFSRSCHWQKKAALPSLHPYTPWPPRGSLVQWLVNDGYKSLATLPQLGQLWRVVPALVLPGVSANASVAAVSNPTSLTRHSSCSPKQSLGNLLHASPSVKEAVVWRTWEKCSFSSLCYLELSCISSFSVWKLVLRKQCNNSFMLICNCKCKNLLLQRYLHFNGLQTLRMKQLMTLYFILRQFSGRAFLGAWKEVPPRCLWNASPPLSLVSCGEAAPSTEAHNLPWPCIWLCVWEYQPYSWHAGGEKLSFSLPAFPWPSPWGPSEFCASSKFKYFQDGRSPELTSIFWAAQCFLLLYHLPNFPGIIHFFFYTPGSLCISTEYCMLCIFIFVVTC